MTVYASTECTDIFICASGIIGILFAAFQFRKVAQISLTHGPSGNQAPLVTSLGIDTTRLLEIYEAIREGADSFLLAEYTICAYFLAGFGVIVLLVGLWNFLLGESRAVVPRHARSSRTVCLTTVRSALCWNRLYPRAILAPPSGRRWGAGRVLTIDPNSLLWRLQHFFFFCFYPLVECKGVPV
jgi:hypothetical protein